MRYRTLGNSTLLISSIGFGCMSLGGEETDNTRLAHRALELGINFFDTADIYEKGLNEEQVGRILKGKREQVVIASKVGNQWRSDGSGLDWNPGKEHILRSVEGSLTRLRTDRIDLYQLHGGTLEDPIDETIEAFELLQQQGKIRYYGISSIRPDIIREYARRSGIVSVMMQYSLLDRRPEESCLELLQKAGIGVLARGTVAKGLLAGKAAAPYLGYTEAEVRKAAEAVKQAAPVGGGPAEVAIRYVLHHPAVASAVVGLRTTEQLGDAIKAAVPGGSMERELHMLDAILPPGRYEMHR
ncbi:MAG TPA: aldo/keto reductase [Puia sp.]|nr:aldo/keto reductase [Puia sp.]